MSKYFYQVSSEKWPELAENIRPTFPIQYLPEDCAR